MKTFAEYLLDKPGLFTAEVREIVEAFWSYPCDCEMKKAVALMRATPPAKEPVSVEFVARYPGVIATLRDGNIHDVLTEYKPGDRLRVVKIEEMK